MPYPGRSVPFDPRRYGTYQGLMVTSALNGGPDSTRQQVIESLVDQYGLDKGPTKSLAFDPAVNLPGRNVAGDVRIGPQAFTQDGAWLTGIVFHELIHSFQYAYYSAQGITQINPKASDVERRMIALDEHEAHTWTLMRRSELALSQGQQDGIPSPGCFCANRVGRRQAP